VKAHVGLKGFTLIEFLIALAILSVIAAVSFTSFVSVRRTVDIGRRNNERMREIRTFLERLDAELSGVIFIKNDEGTPFTTEQGELGSLETSSLSFAAIVPQSLFEVGRRGEVMRIEYSVSPNEFNKELLVVRKKIHFLSLPPGSNDEPVEFIIGEEFTNFLFRFKSEGRWLEAWNSDTRQGLPESIELVFSLGGRTYREVFNVYISER
jgi:type II secretion system protein J